jgi:hypothetical protein
MAVPGPWSAGHRHAGPARGDQPYPRSPGTFGVTASGPAEAAGRWPPDYAGESRKNRFTCIDVAEKTGTLAKLRRSWRPGPRLPRGGTGVLFGNRISGRGSFRSACGSGETSNVDINHTGLAGRDRSVMHAGLGGRGASAPRRDLSSVVCGADRSRPEQTSSVWKAA